MLVNVRPTVRCAQCRRAVGARSSRRPVPASCGAAPVLQHNIYRWLILKVAKPLSQGLVLPDYGCHASREAIWSELSLSEELQRQLGQACPDATAPVQQLEQLAEDILSFSSQPAEDCITPAKAPRVARRPSRSPVRQGLEERRERRRVQVRVNFLIS